MTFQMEKIACYVTSNGTNGEKRISLTFFLDFDQNIDAKFHDQTKLAASQKNKCVSKEDVTHLNITTEEAQVL